MWTFKSNDHISKISMSPPSPGTRNTSHRLCSNCVFYTSKLGKIKTQTCMFTHQPPSHLIVNVLLFMLLAEHTHLLSQMPRRPLRDSKCCM